LLYEQSLAIERELGDQRAIAIVLNNLGMVAAYHRNDYSAARLLHEEALPIRRELSDRSGIAGSLTDLGTVACEHGDHPSSRALLTESLAMRRDLADRLGVAELRKHLPVSRSPRDRPGPGARLCGQAA
jgi:Tetratricopeptide repeat